MSPDWKGLAAEMRAAGVQTLECDGDNRVRKITLSDNPPPPPPPEEPVLDTSPLANAAAVADMKIRLKAEIKAEMEAERDRYRFAASEGLL